MDATTFVIDLSHWNTVTDFKLTKQAGIVGVVHKFSQGASYRDDAYSGRLALAKTAGLRFGRYHFGDGSDVGQQVTNFLAGWDRNAREELALDYEDNKDSQMSLDQACDFIAAVRAQTGVTPMLYTGNTLKEAMGTTADARLAGVRLWIAQYAFKAVLPPGFANYYFWQYTAQGECPGISGDCDLNRIAMQPFELDAAWGIGDAAPTAQPGAPVQAAAPSVSITLEAGTTLRIVSTGKVNVELVGAAAG